MAEHRPLRLRRSLTLRLRSRLPFALRSWRPAAASAAKAERRLCQRTRMTMPAREILRAR